MSQPTFSCCQDCTSPGEGGRCARMGKCLQLPAEVVAALDDIFGTTHPGLSGPLRTGREVRVAQGDCE